MPGSGGPRHRDDPRIGILGFKAEAGPTGELPIDIQLAHRSRTMLETAARELAERLSGYAGVTDIDDGVSLGKTQLNFRIKPEARNLGLNATDLARQVRGAFYGVEALRQQRGRNEVKVMVRLPESERRSSFTIEHLILLTEQGGEIPLAEAAEIEAGRAYTEINRREGRRITAVTADIDDQIANANSVMAEVAANELEALTKKYPGLTYSVEGQQAEQQESLSALGTGFALAMLLIYALLADSLQELRATADRDAGDSLQLHRRADRAPAPGLWAEFDQHVRHRGPGRCGGQ